MAHDGEDLSLDDSQAGLDIRSMASATTRDEDRADRDDDDDDAIFEELEKEIDEDPDVAGLRERRMEELKQEFEKMRDMRENDHGVMTEMADEKEVMKTSASEKRCVIHFYHRDFKRCEIMNQHLEKLARKYFSTRFLKVFVENVPWLVEKLQIKILPCVICFIDGISKDRLIGFEELGNNDAFTTTALELRLQMSDVLQKAVTGGPSGTRQGGRARGIRSGNVGEDDDSDD